MACINNKGGGGEGKSFQGNISFGSKNGTNQDFRINLPYLYYSSIQSSFIAKITRQVAVKRSGSSCWAHLSKCQMLHFNRKIYLIPNWPFHLWFGNHVVSFRFIKANISLVMKGCFKISRHYYICSSSCLRFHFT